MKKYIINPDTPSQRTIEADYFHLKDDFFWFYSNQDEVVSINKADFITRIDLAAQFPKPKNPTPSGGIFRVGPPLYTSFRTSVRYTYPRTAQTSPCLRPQELPLDPWTVAGVSHHWGRTRQVGVLTEGSR